MDNDAFLGYVGLHEVESSHGRAVITLWMVASSGWNIHAAEATQAVLAFGFTDVGLGRVSALTPTGEQSMSAVLRQVGLRKVRPPRNRTPDDAFECVSIWEISLAQWLRGLQS